MRRSVVTAAAAAVLVLACATNPRGQEEPTLSEQTSEAFREQAKRLRERVEEELVPALGQPRPARPAERQAPPPTPAASPGLREAPDVSPAPALPPPAPAPWPPRHSEHDQTARVEPR